VLLRITSFKVNLTPETKKALPIGRAFFVSGVRLTLKDVVLRSTVV